MCASRLFLKHLLILLAQAGHAAWTELTSLPRPAFELPTAPLDLGQRQ
jgi:hypothetical protein